MSEVGLSPTAQILKSWGRLSMLWDSVSWANSFASAILYVLGWGLPAGTKESEAFQALNELSCHKVQVNPAIAVPDSTELSTVSSMPRKLWPCILLPSPARAATTSCSKSGLHRALSGTIEAHHAAQTGGPCRSAAGTGIPAGPGKRLAPDGALHGPPGM